MAFDQSTRNRLQKFVSNARAILGEEFTRQLQATYGLDPKQGTVAAIDSLTHLDNRQRQTAHLLRETLAHYLSTTPGKGEKDRTKQVLDRIVREQAFTVLNRLAALRMAEARGFLLESIAKAHSSKGFQLYRQLSGTAHGETGDAYRNYLFSLFDEFSLDLAVLFDRHSAQGRLFPRETALLELLAEINHHEIEHLWAEDETIGWIYQYFNSQDERKKMRAESQAPRNSRELAVRNQFFTPRYVVEFLTDNTLGRIWYEMTQGNTALVDSCRYLVRRPTEIFLKPGETAPEAETSDNEALSQEELLKQPVYIPHRPLKDPRSIRMLDPACGSMHFGLYAFDLFEHIYLEAWQLEQQLGPDAFAREAGQQALQSTFDSLEVFKQQIPKLIIEHNIHGVDIDPRAVQIAGLSLWQRAQRAWHQQGIKPQQRPTIVKSNIVCAEPMPGEKALLQEFTSKLNPPVLGQLLEVIFDKMQLAGEAGTLLKIEEEIQIAIHEAREQWLKQSGSNSVGDMFQAELDAAIPQAKLGFDLRGIDDATFWDDAEQRILQALSDYADQAESNADQKRLFAEDAAKGFAFIDLCRKRFDVVLMNPPFGEHAIKTKSTISGYYPASKNDMYACFVDRGVSILEQGGQLGAITNKTGFFLQTFESWREKITATDSRLELAVDLGFGVLDTAMVETMAYTLKKSYSSDHGTSFVRLIGVDDKGKKLESLVCDSLFEKGTTWIRKIQTFKDIPYKPICYWISNNFIEAFKRNSSFSEVAGHIYQGIATGDNFRFLRLRWEVPNDDIENNWPGYVKGGTSSRWFSPIRLCVNWANDGAEIKANAKQCYGSASRTIKNEAAYFKSGGTYTQVTVKGFGVRAMPSSCVFDMKGPFVEFKGIGVFAGLAITASTPFRALARLVTDNRQWHPTNIMVIPFPKLTEAQESKLDSLARMAIFLSARSYANDETSGYFRDFDLNEAQELKLEDIEKAIDELVADLYEVRLEEFAELNNLFEGESFLDNSSDEEGDHECSIGEQETEKAHCSYLLGAILGRWSEDVKSRVNQSVFDPFLLPKICMRQEFAQIAIPVNDRDDFSRVLNGYISDEYAIAQPSFSINSVNFFDYHLSKYSNSRRQAPIYWPLQTPSGSYTLWVYYHRLNEQTLYTCVNDFIDGPNGKLTQVEQDLNGLRSKSARSSQEEKELEKLSDLASELRDFRDELLRLAKFWKPNLNDGVQITAAPLWKLFQHKAWQKKLKETWDSLEKGDYDWAHLACSIWPDRVLRKCHQDRSLAIAHDVEEYFWHEVEVPVKRGKKLSGETKLEWQPKELNEPALLAVIKQIKEERGL